MEDTDRRVYQQQANLMANWSASKKFERLCEMNDLAISFAKKNLREKFPNDSENQIKLKFIELAHGSEVADRFAKFFTEPSSK